MKNKDIPKHVNLDVQCNPEKYGFKQCPHCAGYGSSLKEKAAICSVCNGIGLVKIDFNYIENYQI
jgi:DnaJ-class molecular chaperone